MVTHVPAQFLLIAGGVLTLYCSPTSGRMREIIHPRFQEVIRGLIRQCL